MELTYILATVVSLNILIFGLAIILINELEIRILNRIKRILEIMEQYNERIYELEKKALEIYSNTNKITDNENKAKIYTNT